MTTVADVQSAVERLWPRAGAEAWDAVGLIAGDPDDEVRRILLAVDAVLDTAAEAVSSGADLLLVHHPLLLRGVTSVLFGPFARQFAFGLQHVLIMYTGCITVPLVFGAAVGLDRDTIAMLISADLLIAGLITIVQSLGVGKLGGVRLPIVCGATFAGLTPMILIAKEYGLQAVYGSMLIGGIVGLALAWPFARIIRFFPPLVTGAVLTVVGISLIGVAGGLIVVEIVHAASTRRAFRSSSPSGSAS